MDNIKQQIVEIFKNHNIDVLKINEDQSLIESGITDSMTFVNILLEIEDHFNVEIDFEKVDLASIVSINGLTKYIETL